MVRNRKLSKSIADVSWNEFIRQLEYKSKWKGRTLVKVDRFYPSSQICSSCGHNDGKKGLSIHRYVHNLNRLDRKSTRLNSSHVAISYAVFCLKKKTS